MLFMYLYSLVSHTPETVRFGRIPDRFFQRGMHSRHTPLFELHIIRYICVVVVGIFKSNWFPPNEISSLLSSTSLFRVIE